MTHADVFAMRKLCCISLCMFAFLATSIFGQGALKSTVSSPCVQHCINMYLAFDENATLAGACLTNKDLQNCVSGCPGSQFDLEKCKLSQACIQQVHNLQDISFQGAINNGPKSTMCNDFAFAVNCSKAVLAYLEPNDKQAVQTMFKFMRQQWIVNPDTNPVCLNAADSILDAVGCNCPRGSSTPFGQPITVDHQTSTTTQNSALTTTLTISLESTTIEGFRRTSSRSNATATNVPNSPRPKATTGDAACSFTCHIRKTIALAAVVTHIFTKV